MRDRPILADVLLGDVAGAVATFVMDKITTLMYERQPEDIRRAENKARRGKTASSLAIGARRDRRNTVRCCRHYVLRREHSLKRRAQQSIMQDFRAARLPLQKPPHDS